MNARTSSLLFCFHECDLSFKDTLQLGCILLRLDLHTVWLGNTTLMTNELECIWLISVLGEF